MAKQIGDKLPQEIVRAFDGKDIEDKIGKAYLLVTTDEDGTPRPCMLSAGEILVTDEKHLRVALWPGTNTSKNLGRGDRILFCYIAPGSVVYARGASNPLPASSQTKLDRFEITVDSAESDIHQGMPVEETVTFSIEGMDRSKVAGEWSRQLEALRA